MLLISIANRQKYLSSRLQDLFLVADWILWQVNSVDLKIIVLSSHPNNCDLGFIIQHREHHHTGVNRYSSRVLQDQQNQGKFTCVHISRLMGQRMGSLRAVLKVGHFFIYHSRVGAGFGLPRLI